MNLYNERFFQAPYNMPTYAKGIGLTFTSDRNPTSRTKDMSNQVIPGISHSLARVTRGMHDQYTPMDEEFFFRKGGLAEQVLGRAQFEGRVHYPYMGKESILHKEGARLVLTGNNFYYPEASFFRKVHMETLEESFFGHMSDLMSRYLDEMTPGLGPRQRDSELSKLFFKAYIGRPCLL